MNLLGHMLARARVGSGERTKIGHQVPVPINIQDRLQPGLGFDATVGRHACR